ncbi:MAG: hypothetical protein SF070_06090 [Gemmatimonadota bacterium]|nr:hypothetical protein [Gemmatimonadota bacterium]
MNRVTRGTVVLAVALAALSCKGDPTDSLRGGVDHLVATPSSIFMFSGDVTSILVEAVDEQGNRQGTSFNLGTVGAGITVAEDDSFNLVFDENGNQVKPKNWPRVQYVVTATGNTGNSSFVVSAGGKNLTIPVRIIPNNLAQGTLSNAAPALGDTVQVIAPAPFKFTPASVVTLTGAAAVTIGISADSSQISFLAGPNANGPVSVSNTILSYAPTIGVFTLTTAAAFTTPPVSFVGALSSTTAQVGDTVTVTVAPGSNLRVRLNSAVTFGALPGLVASVAPDSLSMQVIPPPGVANTPATISNVILSFLPAVPLSLPTSNNLTVAGNRFAGKDDPATAPVLPVLAVNSDTLLFFDSSDFIDQFYRIDAPAGSNFLVQLSWPGTGAAPDIDLLACNLACSAFIGGFGGATGSLPENLTLTFATATSFNLWINVYAGTPPARYQIRIIRTS